MMPTTNAIAFSCKVQGHVYRCALSIGSFRGNPSQRWMRVCSGLAVRRTPRFSRMGLVHRPGSLFMVSFGGLHAMTLHHGTSASEFSLLSPPRSLDQLNHSLNEDLAGITPFWSQDFGDCRCPPIPLPGKVLDGSQIGPWVHHLQSLVDAVPAVRSG